MTSGHRPPWPVTTLTIRIILTKLTNLTTLTILTNQKNYQEDKCRIRSVYLVLFIFLIHSCMALSNFNKFRELSNCLFWYEDHLGFFPAIACVSSFSTLGPLKKFLFWFVLTWCCEVAGNVGRVTAIEPPTSLLFQRAVSVLVVILVLVPRRRL